VTVAPFGPRARAKKSRVALAAKELPPSRVGQQEALQYALINATINLPDSITPVNWEVIKLCSMAVAGLEAGAEGVWRPRGVRHRHRHRREPHGAALREVQAVHDMQSELYQESA